MSTGRTYTRRELLARMGAAGAGTMCPPFFKRVWAAVADQKVRPHRSSSLFYRPVTTGNLWDTWIYQHRGLFYLYYLSWPIGQWHGANGARAIAMATSRDGVHWQERGNVLQAAPDVAWMGSGSVWPVNSHSASTERFIMNFSEWRGPENGGRQTMFFAESRDLLHWERLEGAYEFRQDTRWYEPKGRWDNIWTLPRPGGGRYGYWAANPKGKVGFGFGETLDGLRWQALEPPDLREVSLSPEIGAVHVWRDKYYMMVGSWDGSVDNPGMSVVVGDSPSGPFSPASKNRRLLVGNDAYFSRFVDTADGVLVNHHCWETVEKEITSIYLAPLKRAVWDEEGTLRLMWWEGNERAKGERLHIARIDAEARIPQLLKARFDTSKLLIVEGSVMLPDSNDGTSWGVYLQGSDRSGTAFIVSPNGRVDYGTMSLQGQFEKQGSVDRDIALPPRTRFRLVRMGRLTEFYLNDVLMQCYCLPEQGSGQLGFFGVKASFEALDAWC